ncbi:MAG TPA: arylsulfotransferase family protein [Gaiellaceae bacterium]|nr:arylsulfotransferase family protein [Gaiellaceae bacterium]
METLSRRGFLVAAAAGVAALSGRGAGTARAAGERSRFLTAPGWKLPELVVEQPAAGTAPGYIFLAPFGSKLGASPGPLVVDDTGSPVWFLPLKTEQAQNFRVQSYRGAPVLTWYESQAGQSGTALYGGTCVIYDPRYRQVKRVHGGHGYALDLHEFVITSRNTALLAIANVVQTGGVKVVEGIVQELDIDSGKVLFEWHSLDHVPLGESFRPNVTSDGTVDYFHLNSIGVAPDGNLIVSARHTSTIYKLHRKSGAVLWRLGGMRNEFALGDGAAFAFQHDARLHADGTLTVFDNGATDAGAGKVEPYSRPLRLALDEKARTAGVLQVFQPPTPRLTTAMGNLQVLPDGGVFVGWGTAGAVSEFAPDGTLRFDCRLADGSSTYRAYRLSWQARPTTAPAIILERSGGGFTANVSWNGATDVAHWEARVGKARRRTARTGFETPVPVPATTGVLSVAALDARGRELAATKPFALPR